MIMNLLRWIVWLRRCWRVWLAVRRTVFYEWHHGLLTKDLRREDVAPWPAELMMTPDQPAGTICGVLGEIHERSDDEEIRRLARLAVAMGKKMSAKLHYYRDVTAG